MPTGNRTDDGASSDDEQPSKESSSADTFQPVTSQADLDRIVGERVKRERAKYADYADLKAKASRLDELEAANKSDLEKAEEARVEAEKARDDAIIDDCVPCGGVAVRSLVQVLGAAGRDVRSGSVGVRSVRLAAAM